MSKYDGDFLCVDCGPAIDGPHYFPNSHNAYCTKCFATRQAHGGEDDGDSNDQATQHWAVTVSRNGEDIVTIESNCLSGREIGPEEELAIRIAANHLLAFIGDPHAKP